MISRAPYVPQPRATKQAMAETGDQTDFAHAIELYNQAKTLSEKQPLDEETALLIIEAADDAIKQFGNTNQSRKVELKKLKAKAELIVAPKSLDELKKRAEGFYLNRFYPRNHKARVILFGVVGLFFIAGVLLSLRQKLFPDPPATASNANATTTVNPSPTLAPSPSPTASLNAKPPEVRPAPLPTPTLPPDEQARRLKQEAERLIIQGKYQSAISRLNQALLIAGITRETEAELQGLRLKAVTASSHPPRPK